MGWNMILRLLLVMAVLPSSLVSAHARDTTRAYTCEGVKALVKQRGAVVLDTTSNRVYQRFVSNRSQCSLEEKTSRYYVPTKSGKCQLRICVELKR